MNLIDSIGQRFSVFAGVIAAAVLLLAPASAPAQIPNQPVPPTSYSLDDRGVDLVTGLFNFTTQELVIGQPGQGGIVYGRTFLRLSPTASPNWRDLLIGGISHDGSEYQVSLGGESEAFLKSGTTFTPKMNSGATLVQSGSAYIFTSASGAVANFDGGLASGGTSIYGATDALISNVTTPSGERTEFHYRVETVCMVPNGSGGCLQYRQGWRLQSITNNRGYQIHYDYASESPANARDWFTTVAVTGLNNTIDYCAPVADDCTYTRTWPSVSYSGGNTTDQSGRTTAYTYGANGLTSVRYPGSTSDDITVAYQASGTVQSVTNATGAWTYVFNDGGPPMRSTTTTGPLSQVEYALANRTTNRVVMRRNTLNNAWIYQYDGQGRLTRVTQPEGNYTAYAYDSFGNVTETRQVAKTGPSPATDIVSSAAYPTTCVNPVLCHRPLTTTEPRGAVTDYIWDATHGGILTVTAPSPGPGQPRPQTRVSYAPIYAWYKDNTGTIVQAASSVSLPTAVSQCATGSTCVGTVDEVRSLVSYGAPGGANNLLPTVHVSTDGAGTLTATETTTLDANGDLYTVDGPLPGADDTTRYRFDAARQMTGVIGPDPDGAGPALNRAMRFTYSARGKVTLAEVGAVAGQGDAQWSTFNALSRTAITFDGFGREVRTEMQTGPGATYAVSQTSYDSAGRQDCAVIRMNPVTFASLPGSACALGAAGVYGPDRITQYAYDTVGRLITSTSGLGLSSPSIERLTWTANNQTATTEDADANVTAYTYDGFDRLARTRYPIASTGAPNNADDELLGYDKASNVISNTGRDDAVFATTYDALNRPTAVDGPGSVTDAAFTYDNLGRPLTATASTGVVTSTWDSLGRQTSEVGPLGAMAFAHDLAGRRTRITWPTAQWVDYDYNVSDDMTAVRWQGAVSGPDVLARYAYNDLGLRTTITRGNGVITTYAYDATSRLSSLAHDLAGAGSDQVLSYLYNPASQIVSQTASNALYVYMGSPTGPTNYTVNRLNQITAASGSGAITYNANQVMTNDGVRAFTFDAENRLTSSGASTLTYDALSRLQQMAGTNGGTYAYDGSEITATAASGTVVSDRYIRGAGPDEIIASVSGTSTLAPTWWIQDQAGSTIALTDAAGAATTINTYDEYGRPGSANAGAFQYTGQLWAADLGVYHYKARQYQPSLGRFLQPDPIGYGDGANLYNYVSSDPTNLTDPTGASGRRCYEVWTSGLNSQGGGGWNLAGTTCIISADLLDWQVRFAGSNRGGSISRFFPGYDQSLHRPSIYDDPQYRPYKAATDKAARDNRWMIIPVAAPVAVVVGLEVGAVVAASRVPGAVRAVCNCFAAETEVATADGLKAIEDVRIGDLVLSRDEFTGETSLRPVTALIAGDRREIWEVRVETVEADGQVRSEVIRTTEEHPWAAAAGGWLITRDLVAGTELATSNLGTARVIAVSRTNVSELTFNLEIDGFHTYFVGVAGVWVHNACKPPPRINPWKDTKTGRELADRIPGPAAPRPGGSPASQPRGPIGVAMDVLRITARLLNPLD